MDVRDVSRYRPVMCWKRCCGFSTQVRNGTCCRKALLRKMLPNALPLFVREPNHSAFIADRQRASARGPSRSGMVSLGNDLSARRMLFALGEQLPHLGMSISNS